MRQDEQFVEEITLDAGGDGAGANFEVTNGLGFGGLPLWGFMATVSGRAVVGTAAATLVPVLSPTTFIERILVQGDLAGRAGKVTLFDLPGSLAYAFAAMVTGLYPQFDEDALVGGAGAVATHDFRFQIPVPLCVIGKMNAADEMVARTLLLPGQFSGPLEVTIRTGGNDSIIDRAATSTVTMTAYGSGSGSPSVDITAVRYRLGPGEQLGAGRRYLAQKSMRTTTLGSNVTNNLIARLIANQKLARILLRVGDLDSDSDPALGGVSNTAVDRLTLKIGSLLTIRNVNFIPHHFMEPWFAGRDEGWRELIATAAASLTSGQAPRELVGCTLWDFVKSGMLGDALDLTEKKFNNEDLELHGNVTTETGLQVEAMYETLMDA